MTAYSKRLPWWFAGSFFLVLLAGCAGDSPEAVKSALDDAVPTLAYVDDVESTCVAGVILDHVGFEQLAADGHSSESIALNPESVTDIVAAHDSDDLRAAMLTCFDVDDMFEARLVQLNADNPLRCAEPGSATEEIDDQVVDKHFASDESPLEIDDTIAHRDLLRECLDEGSFAELFDIDLAADLVAAIDDELGSRVQDDDVPCVGDLLLEAVGSAEALNELGVTVAEPDFSLAALELGTETTDELTSDIFDCSAFVARTAEDLRLEEPILVPCIVDELSENEAWRNAKVTDALESKSPSYSATRREDNAVDTCLRAHIEKTFGEFDRNDFAIAKDFGVGFWEGSMDIDPGIETYGHALTNVQCAAYGLLQEVSLLEWIEAVAPTTENPESMTQQEFDRFIEAISKLTTASRKCAGDFDFLAVDVSRAGFSVETIECVKESLGDISALADVWDAGTTAMDEDTIAKAEAIPSIIHDAVKTCHRDDERAIFEAWDNWLNGVGETTDFGEPDSVST